MEKMLNMVCLLNYCVTVAALQKVAFRTISRTFFHSFAGPATHSQVQLIDQNIYNLTCFFFFFLMLIHTDWHEPQSKHYRLQPWEGALGLWKLYAAPVPLKKI